MKGLWILGLSVLTTAAMADLASDPRLTKTITVRDKIVSLELFAQEMTAKTQVPILVSPKLLDLKITAICADRPAGELLDRVATTFQFQWEKVKDGYRLVEPADLARDEKDLLDQELKLSRATAQGMIDSWMKESKRSLDEIHTEVESLKIELKGLEDDRREPANKRRKEINKRLIDLLDFDGGGLSYYGGKIFSQMSGKDWDRFWAGKTVVGSTLADSAPFKLPPEAVNDHITMRTEQGEEHPMGEFQFLRYRPEKGMETQMQAVFKSNVGSGKTGNTFARFDGAALQALKNHPFHKRWQAWVTQLTANAPLYKKPFPKDAPKRTLHSPYFNSLISMADHLEYLADTAGVPVVADAFRAAASFEGEESPAPTVGAWVDRWTKARAIGGTEVKGGFFHVEGDWLLFRHAGFWDLKRGEVSEKVLARMESKDVLALDDYAAFTAALTPAQEDAFADDWWILTRFSAMPIAEAGPGLRVWATLGITQKSQARSAQGISAQSLSPTGQAVYWDAVLESMWRTIILADRVRSALFRGSDPELEQRMRFILQENIDVFLRPDAPKEDANGYSTFRTQGNRFLFGTDPDTAAQLSFKVVPPKKSASKGGG